MSCVSQPRSWFTFIRWYLYDSAPVWSPSHSWMKETHKINAYHRPYWISVVYTCFLSLHCMDLSFYLFHKCCKCQSRLFVSVLRGWANMFVNTGVCTHADKIDLVIFSIHMNVWLVKKGGGGWVCEQSLNPGFRGLNVCMFMFTADWLTDSAKGFFFGVFYCNTQRMIQHI